MGGGPAKDHLLCLFPFPEPVELLEKLREKFPGLDVIYKQVAFTKDIKQLTDEVSPELFHDATILCTFRAYPAKPSDAPNLQVVQLLSAGSNQIQDHWLYTDSDVTICTASGVHGPQIAEWVVMTALVQSHSYNRLHEMQKRHQWKHESQAIGEVRDRVGLRLGVLGYGSIGRQVGRVAKALGMEVLAYTASPKDTRKFRRENGYIVPGTGDPEGDIPVEWFSGLDKKSLHHFLSQDLDWLVVSVPLTAQTRQFLSSTEFKILGKRKAFITNIARGPILDQLALIEALKDGTLGGAALDVTDPEPLPADSELWDLPNVTVTPHISGSGTSYTQRALGVLELNVERKENGKELVNVVRRDRGY